jgi:hypothetical protein
MARILPLSQNHNTLYILSIHQDVARKTPNSGKKQPLAAFLISRWRR